MKLSHVLDEVKKELVARVLSAEESATYGIKETVYEKYKVKTEDGAVVIVRIPDPRHFLKDSTEYLLNAEWFSMEGFPLEISLHQDEIILKPRSTV